MRQLVIGIDYGTSNSGVAYALFDDNDDLTPGNVDISVVKDIARGKFGQDSSEKVPSDIAYDEHWEPCGQGYDIPKNPDAHVIQWVKLLLEPQGLRGKRNTQKVWSTYETLSSNKKPVGVVADYLRWLWERTKACIMDKMDEENLFETLNLTVVLTVPASWSEKGKHRMLKAATIAGIADEAQSIRLIPEAEAAAIFGLTRQAKRAAVTENDCVIICDAGGGTVDVIGYQVVSRHPLSIDQRTMSKGAFCGSVFIDLEFQNQLQSILGDEYNALDNEAKTRIEDKFEFDIKRTFHPQDTNCPKHYSIPLSQYQEREIESEVIGQSFESIMTSIETLLENQIDKLRKLGLEKNLGGILLVGGLSKSEYFYQRIRDGYSSQSLKVWRSDDPWTAVAQGAVYCETTAVIHSRLSKHNYGILYRDADKKCVHWIVTKHQSVKNNMPTEPFALRVDDQSWLDKDEYFRLRITLVRSDQDDPSEEFNEQRVKPHAVIDCRFPTSILSSDSVKLVQEKPKAWHIPARFVPVLNGAVISFRCKVEDDEVGLAELNYFDDEDQDFHPHPQSNPDSDALSINPAPRNEQAGQSTGSIRQIPTNSSSGQTSRKNIRDYHFNIRVDRDTPPDQRPRPGTLPGLFARGWIPREDFYTDYEAGE